MPRLTKRTIDALQPLENADVFVWDSEIRGLGLRLKPSGVKSFFVQYRNRAKRTRRMVIGQYGVLTVDEARSQAREYLVDVIRGEDPSAARKSEQELLTVEELCKWYLREAGSKRLLGRRGRPIKDSTLAMDRSRINVHIIPLIGRQLISGLKRGDIERMQADIVEGKTAKRRDGRGGHTTGGEGVACRAISTLHAIFEHGIRRDLIENNPARGTRRIAEKKRDRRLSTKEIVHLGRVMSECLKDGENPTGIAAIKFILLTGFRRMEALGLKRAWLDSTITCARFPDTKSGRQIRTIGKSAASVIRTQCRKLKSDYVFASEIGEGHFVGAAHVMERVMKKAGFDGVTLHTLRHTFASMGGELGFTELTIAGLLGHSARGVTQRYIHLDEALQVAADRISTHIEGLLDQGAKQMRKSSQSVLTPSAPRNQLEVGPKMQEQAV